jgi:uncharacterized protein
LTAIEKEGRIKEAKEMASYIKSKFSARDIILFGSYAYGTPTNDSDIDLLIISETKLRPVKQAIIIKKELNRKFGIKFPMDIIVRTPEFVHAREKQDFFIKKVINEGLYL